MNDLQARIIAEAEAEAGITNEPVIGADGKPVPKQKLRAGFQGLTFGGGDEIEAAIRAVLPESMGGGEYEQIRDELRQKLKDYAKAYPAESIGSEIAGALLPTVAAFSTGGGSIPASGNIARIIGTAAPTGQGIQKLKQVAGTAAAQSGLGALGYSEAENISPEQATDVGVGTGVGAAIGTGLTYGAGGAGVLARKVMDFARNKFGDRADTAIQQELSRLVTMTGKSEDQIIQDIIDGRVIADNETLTFVLKSYVNQGGAASADILKASAARTEKTGDVAVSDLRESLTPDADDINVVRSFREDDKTLSAQQSKAYDEVFDAGQNLPVETTEEMLNVIQRVPETRAGLERIYQAENLVPLFKELEGGAIEFARAPTLRDAEIVRRVLTDIKGAEFSAGRGQMGSTIGDLESGLRTQIDTASPELGAVRASYAGKMAARESFDLGRNRGLTMNVDELSYMMEGLKGEALDAFRAGVMDALNNKARRSGVMLRNLANEDQQIGAALRAVLPAGRQSDEALKSVSIAAEAAEMNKEINKRAGSQTQGLQQEARNQGLGITAEDALRGSQGDVYSIMRMFRNLLPQKTGLSDAQIQQVAQVLYSESPELVEQALTDPTMQGRLIRRIENLIEGGLLATRRPAQQQSSQAATGN